MIQLYIDLAQGNKEAALNIINKEKLTEEAILPYEEK